MIAKTTAIASIQIDHQRFEALLACLDSSVDGLSGGAAGADGADAGVGLVHSIIDYVQSFLDQFHHPKEDEYLFRVLRHRHPAAEGLLNDLREQHFQGRLLLVRLKAALADFEGSGEAAYGELRAAATDYVAFERKHIGIEERDVLPLARRVLEIDDWHEINAAFAANDDPLFGDDRKRKYELLFTAISYVAAPPHGRGLGPSAARG